MSVSASERRQAAVSYAILALAALAAIFFALGTPIRARAAFFATLESQRATYTKSIEALARSETVSAEFALRKAESDVTSQVFHAETAALAGADLQNQLNALVAAEGGTLLSSAFRESTADGPLTPIAVTIRMRCSMEALVRILHGLENRSPALFVEGFSVQSRRRSGLRQHEGDGDLDAELNVVGFLDGKAAP